jgi:hypothetical protein
VVAFTKRTFAREIYQDFRGKKPLIDELKLVGPDHGELCKPEDEGLRITLPAQRSDKQPVGVRLRGPLSGDFEITATYEALSAMPASGPGSWQAGIALNLSVANDFSKPFAKIGRFSLPQRGDRFVVESWNKEKSTQQTWKEHPAPSRMGKLRLVREGSVLSYQAADGSGDEFREVYRGQFSPDDVALVRFAVAGHPVHVDARLIDLRIRYGAQALADSRAPAPRAIDSTDGPSQPGSTSGRPGGWLAAMLLIGAIVVALFLLAVVGTRWHFHRPQQVRTKPAEPASQTPSTVGFTCPSCHRRIKAKAALTGKKIKCPGCGKAIDVPPPKADDDLPIV